MKIWKFRRRQRLFHNTGAALQLYGRTHAWRVRLAKSFPNELWSSESVERSSDEDHGVRRVNRFRYDM